MELLTLLWIASIATLAGIFTWTWLNHDEGETASPERSLTVVGSSRSLQNKTNVPHPNVYSGLPTIRTGLDDAARINTPWKAWINTVGTNSRITALENAERFANATEQTAQAETKAIDALIRRAERFHDLHVAQLLENENTENRVAERRHEIFMDILRRDTAALEAQRKLLSAKHGLEATKRFKPTKFALGQARYGAKIADKHVETAVARAAAEPQKKLNGKASIGSLVADSERLLEQLEADGKDTAEIRDTLSRLEQMLKPRSGGA